MQPFIASDPADGCVDTLFLCIGQKIVGHQLLISSLQYGIKSRKAFLGGATCLFNSIYNNVKIVVQRKGGVFVCVYAWSTCLVYIGISRKGR